MNVWIAVVVVGAGSYALRAAPLFWTRCNRLSSTTRSRFEMAGTASLVALAVTAMRHQTVDVDRAAGVAATAALIVGSVLAVRRRPLHTVALVGVLVHVAVGAIAGAAG